MTAERAYPLERRSRSVKPSAIHRLIYRAAVLFSRKAVARAPLCMRLALYHGVFAGALVAAVIFASYWQLNVALRDRAYAELHGEWQLVREALTHTTRAALAERNPEAIAALRADHPGLSIAVLGSDASLRVALGKESAELAAVATALETAEILEFDWDDCRLAAVAGPAELAGGTAVRLAVGIDRTADRELLAARKHWLVLLAVASMILIGVLAAIIARGALAPLRQFSKQVSAISATQLARRMDERNVPQELQEFARTFNRLLENLDEAFNRLRAFSSDIAHELRTPLANLAGKTQLALSRVRTAAEYRQTLEANAEELEHMIHMVANMVFLAQVENAVAALEHDHVDLRALCEEVAEFYQLAGEERSVRIEVSGRGSVRADRKLIQRALGNLLSNAIRHTPSREAIRMRITAPAGEAAVIEVENPGRGIAPELQSRIFERFVRGEDTDTPNHGASGTGLGLAIVRSIMTLHGGSAQVISQPEGPTIFSLHFPKRRPVAE